MYNKLFAKILDSSIWLEADHVRLVWITFLAMMDQDGMVALSSVGNVANRARVPEDKAADAIAALESPDTRNPDQDHEGRRIERVPGVGWFVINAEKYRDIVRAEQLRLAARERQRKHRSKENVTVGHALSHDVTNCNGSVTSSEAESEEEKKDILEDSNISVEPKPSTAVGNEKPEGRPRPDANRNLEEAQKLFEFWQTTLSHETARFTAERRKKVLGRLAAGYTPDDIRKAILGCKASPHHQGENERGVKYDDLELVCRSDTKLEQFMSYAHTNGNGKSNNGHKHQNARATDEWREFVTDAPEQAPYLRLGDGAE